MSLFFKDKKNILKFDIIEDKNLIYNSYGGIDYYVNDKNVIIYKKFYYDKNYRKNLANLVKKVTGEQL